MFRRHPWARRVLWAALALLTIEQIWRHGHDYVFPDKFVEVEPGRVYRGAWQHDWPMRRIIRERKIRTIVALAHPPNDPMVVHEATLARELGVKWVHVPIVEESTAAGERKTVADALERAAAVVADPANQPVFFHCHHGVNRASMVQMAYRLQHCGWTLERATDEIRRTVGLVEVKHGVDYRNMAEFYRDRVLPRRTAARASATGPGIGFRTHSNLGP